MKRYLYLVLAMLALHTAPLFAQDGTTGGLKVQLRNADGKVVQTATTNAAGQFTFQKIEMGEYTIFVEQTQIDNAMKAARKAKKAAKKAAARSAADDNDDSDADGAAISFTMTFEENDAYSIVSPRDAASGLPTGKRMHKPVTFVKEWGASSPQLLVTQSGATCKGNWNVKSSEVR